MIGRIDNFCWGCGKTEIIVSGSPADGYFCNNCWAIKIQKQKGDNMNNLIVVQVEVNGKKVPLHEISEQTLLAIRKNSYFPYNKPKEIPVARTAECSGHKYLLLKVPQLLSHFGKYKDRIVAIDLKDGYLNGSWPVEKEQDNPYPDRVYSYKNIQVVS